MEPSVNLFAPPATPWSNIVTIPLLYSFVLINLNTYYSLPVLCVLNVMENKYLISYESPIFSLSHYFSYHPTNIRVRLLTLTTLQYPSYNLRPLNIIFASLIEVAAP
jgi:hypothetical protein